MDLYDARVGGGIAEVLNPPCEGQACRGPRPSVPAEPSAASAGFAGPPNEKPRSCAKGKVRRHGRCLKPKHHGHRRAAKRNRRGVR